jgi:hypothetical protein
LFLLVLVPAAASADLPIYGAADSFPLIHGPLDPEEYSWRVDLQAGQSLRLVDEHHAEVLYEGGERAFQITAELAHDAEGTDVPTSLEVLEPDVISFVVHHRAGNPAAGGAPFVYPIIAGAGWEGGIRSEVVVFPSDEQKLREAREREAREREAKVCLVPRLRGQTLVVSRKRLRNAGCRVGAVGRRHGAAARKGRVVKQTPPPGSKLPAGAGVSFTLAN